jgi:hypothetical protein
MIILQSATRMKISIDIETREVNKRRVDCYIPKINDVPVLGTGFILKESINSEGKKIDNIELAKFFLNKKVNDIKDFMMENLKFIQNSKL